MYVLPDLNDTMDGLVASRGDTEVSHRVVEALAAVRGVDARALDPPLYEVVNAEALDRLVESGATRVRFTYEDHTVQVDGDGTVTVDGVVYVDGAGHGA